MIFQEKIHRKEKKPRSGRIMPAARIWTPPALARRRATSAARRTPSHWEWIWGMIRWGRGMKRGEDRWGMRSEEYGRDCPRGVPQNSRRWERKWNIWALAHNLMVHMQFFRFSEEKKKVFSPNTSSWKGQLNYLVFSCGTQPAKPTAKSQVEYRFPPLLIKRARSSLPMHLSLSLSSVFASFTWKKRKEMKCIDKP